MLSTLLCAYWPFVYLLWIYSLLILKLGYLSFYVVEFVRVLYIF